MIFATIDDIVLKDTGERLFWRHIHGDSAEDHVGILHWTADQHGGQAKGEYRITLPVRPIRHLAHFTLGLGLHLQNRAAEFPNKMDLHEPHRKLVDLTPYDHLHRIFRLCVVHIYRNIKTCKVSETVRNLMRSLICMEHDSWDETISQIESQGGKPAQGVLK